MTTNTSLEDLIRAHEQRIDQVRHEIRAAEDEISSHEALIALGRNERLVAAVVGLRDRDSRTSLFATDPHEYCAQQSITLPEGVTLNPLETRGSSARMTATVQITGGREIEACWDSNTGFSAFGLRLNTESLGPGDGGRFPHTRQARTPP